MQIFDSRLGATESANAISHQYKSIYESNSEESNISQGINSFIVLDGKLVSVASRGTGGPQGRPAKASEFVRAIHGCLRATSSPLSRGDRIFSLAVCYAGRLIGLFF